MTSLAETHGFKFSGKVDFHDLRADQIKGRRRPSPWPRQARPRRWRSCRCRRRSACANRTRAGFCPACRSVRDAPGGRCRCPARERTMPYFAAIDCEVAVVVGVLKPDLDGVVVDVADRQLGGDFHAVPWLQIEGRPWCRWRPASGSGRFLWRFPSPGSRRLQRNALPIIFRLLIFPS